MLDNKVSATDGKTILGKEIGLVYVHKVKNFFKKLFIQTRKWTALTCSCIPMLSCMSWLNLNA